MRKLVLFFLMAVACSAQSLTLSSSASSFPSLPATITMTVVLTIPSSPTVVVPAAVQFTIGWPTGTTVAAPIISGTQTGKSIACGGQANGAQTCIVYGGTTAMVTGNVASFVATVPTGVTGNSFTYTLSSPLGSTAAATSITITGGNSIVTYVPPNKCDVNHSGTVTLDDVQMVLNQALGIITSCPQCDLNSDTKFDVFDVQIVVNAAAGGACTAH